MTTPTRNEKIAALGVVDPTTATRADILTALATQAKTAASAADPGVLDLLVRNTEADLRTRHGKDFGLLREDAVERAQAMAREEWLAQGRAALAAADAALPLVRAELEAAIAAQQKLGGEADEPASSRQERLLAQLLDVHAEATAESWMTTQTPEATIKRYRAAADAGSERAFVRVVERRFAAGVLDLTRAADPLAAASEFGAVIRERQAGRVQPADITAREALDKLRADLDRTAAKLKTGTEAVARVLRSAGKSGTTETPFRQRQRALAAEAEA
jgi:hypothetical protein